MKRKTNEQYLEELRDINSNLEPLEPYVGIETPLLHRCKICSYEWPVRPNNILHGGGCPNCSHKRKRTPEEYIEEIASIHPNIEVLEPYISRHTPILHGCKIDGYKWKRTPGSVLDGQGCPVCSGSVIGYNFENSIWTSPYKNVFEKFMTEEQMKTIMPSSGKRTCMTCPYCGRVKSLSPNQVYRTNSIGCICSDGVSYPNKFVYDVLNQIGIEYETEKTFEWSDKKRYDVYIGPLNCIIENHGEQHYRDGFRCMGARSFDDEQYNDKLKYELAINNGIAEYVVLDCRESEPEWIKNSIMNSKLADFFDLSNIDWTECHKFACSNMVKIASDLWNEGLGTMKIAESMKISETTVTKYLKKAYKCGMCNYTKENSYKRMGEGNKGSKHHAATITLQLTLEDQPIRLWRCMTDAEAELHISMKAISKCCLGNGKSASGYHWKFLYDKTKKDGTVIPGAITLGLITEEEALQQLNKTT